jgi:hypothetical protein
MTFETFFAFAAFIATIAYYQQKPPDRLQKKDDATCLLSENYTI